MTKYAQIAPKSHDKRKNLQVISWYPACMKDDEIRIKNYLLKLGFQPNLKGYKLLARLIELSLCGERILPLKFFGYDRLSQEFGASKDSIEKDIQNAISSAWLRGDVNVLYSERRLMKTRASRQTNSLS